MYKKLNELTQAQQPVIVYEEHDKVKALEEEIRGKAYKSYKVMAVLQSEHIVEARNLFAATSEAIVVISMKEHRGIDLKLGKNSHVLVLVDCSKEITYSVIR